MKESHNFMNAQNFTINQNIVGIINKNYNYKINGNSKKLLFQILVFLIFAPVIVVLFIIDPSSIGTYIITFALTTFGLYFAYFYKANTVYNYNIFTKRPMSEKFYYEIIQKKKFSAIYNNLEKYFYIHK